MKQYILLIFILIFSLGCGDREKSFHTISGKEPIKMSFQKSNTKIFNMKLRDKKKVLIVNFFTTTCSSCQEEIVSLNAMDELYKGRVKVMAILGEQTTTMKIKSFIKKHKISYDIIQNSSDVSFLSRAVGGVYGVPATFVFDKNGKLIDKFYGYTPPGTIKKSVLRAL